MLATAVRHVGGPVECQALLYRRWGPSSFIAVFWAYPGGGVQSCLGPGRGLVHAWGWAQGLQQRKPLQTQVCLAGHSDWCGWHHYPFHFCIVDPTSRSCGAKPCTSPTEGNARCIAAYQAGGVRTLLGRGQGLVRAWGWAQGLQTDNPSIRRHGSNSSRICIVGLDWGTTLKDYANYFAPYTSQQVPLVWYCFPS